MLTKVVLFLFVLVQTSLAGMPPLDVDPGRPPALAAAEVEDDPFWENEMRAMRRQISPLCFDEDPGLDYIGELKVGILKTSDALVMACWEDVYRILDRLDSRGKHYLMSRIESMTRSTGMDSRDRANELLLLLPDLNDFFTTWVHWSYVALVEEEARLRREKPADWDGRAKRVRQQLEWDLDEAGNSLIRLFRHKEALEEIQKKREETPLSSLCLTLAEFIDQKTLPAWAVCDACFFLMGQGFCTEKYTLLSLCKLANDACTSQNFPRPEALKTLTTHVSQYGYIMEQHLDLITLDSLKGGYHPFFDLDHGNFQEYLALILRGKARREATWRRFGLV